MGRKKTAGSKKSGGNKKRMQRERFHTTDGIKAANEHALATAHHPGLNMNHLLKPFDVESLSQAELEQLHSRESLNHLPFTTVKFIIAAYGPEDAQGLGLMIASRNQALRAAGVSQEDIDRKGLLVPVTDYSKINPLSTVFSNEMDLPFVTPVVPIPNEVLLPILKNSMARQHLVMATLPVLPVPVVLGHLRHIITGIPLPPAIDSTQHAQFLMTVLEYLSTDDSLMRKEDAERLMAAHFERLNKTTQDAETIFDIIKAKACAAVGPSFDVLASRIPDFVLVEFEVACRNLALALLVCYEITVKEFISEENHPRVREGVYMSADGSFTITERNVNSDKPFHSGVPVEYIGPHLFIQETWVPKEMIREDILGNLVNSVRTLQHVRREKLGVDASCASLVTRTPIAQTSELSIWKAADEQKAALCTPSYATLEQLREHWNFVYSDREFDQTVLFQEQAGEYQQALLAAASASSADTVPGTLVVHASGISEYAVGDLPDLVPMMASGLPDGSVLAAQPAAAEAAASAHVSMEE
jgi:hypothetical protein